MLKTASGLVVSQVKGLVQLTCQTCELLKQRTTQWLMSVFTQMPIRRQVVLLQTQHMTCRDTVFSSYFTDMNQHKSLLSFYLLPYIMSSICTNLFIFGFFCLNIFYCHFFYFFLVFLLLFFCWLYLLQLMCSFVVVTNVMISSMASGPKISLMRKY